jgi:hypothetical protein
VAVEETLIEAEPEDNLKKRKHSKKLAWPRVNKPGAVPTQAEIPNFIIGV